MDIFIDFFTKLSHTQTFIYWFSSFLFWGVCILVTKLIRGRI